MDFRQMETFVSIASGSFGRAANRLHITQPAISLRISGLEEELGVKLFDRLNGSIQLTTKSSLTRTECSTARTFAAIAICTFR